MSFPYILKDNSLTVHVGAKTLHLTPATHPKYQTLIELIKTKNWSEFEKIVDIEKTIDSFSSGRLTVKNGNVFYGERTLKDSSSKRIISMIRNDIPLDHIVKFFDRLFLNTSYRAVEEAFAFLESNDLPIDEDGFLLAYKRVGILEEDDKDKGFKKGDYVDLYSRTIRNNVGDIPKMDRNEVDDDFRRTCSSGLHFCSMAYLTRSGYGSHESSVIVVVKVDPADIVSIPEDYNRTKGRCSKYEVIGTIDGTENILENEEAPVVKSSTVFGKQEAETAFEEMKKYVTYNRVRKTKASGDMSIKGTVYKFQDATVNRNYSEEKSHAKFKLVQVKNDSNGRTHVYMCSK